VVWEYVNPYFGPAWRPGPIADEKRFQRVSVHGKGNRASEESGLGNEKSEERTMESLVKSIGKRTASFGVVVIMAGVSSNAAFATQWQAWVGAQSPDLGSQALAFLPNEIWIHAGDSIRWTHSATVIHTVTFLTPGEIRPPNFGPVFSVPVGCPQVPGGSTPDGASFDGSSCVNSGILGKDGNIGTGLETYSVSFPTPGNFKLVCLVHTDMTGTVHVLKLSDTLPHDQTFYNIQAATDGTVLVAEASSLRGLPNLEVKDDAHVATVTAGVGAIVTTTGAGSMTASLVRFLQPVIVVRVGDTVEWTDHDPSEPHTITFGTEPADPRPPSTNVSPASDGARQATITSQADSANSGLLAIAFQDRPNLAQSPLGVTRFRVTFTTPGTFNYICALHDNLGMKGTVIVH
jgi:plastocyanin